MDEVYGRFDESLDQAWEFARSVVQMTRATGGLVSSTYYVNTSLDQLGDAEVLLWEAKDQNKEVDEDTFESLIGDALYGLNVVNNRLTKG